MTEATGWITATLSIQELGLQVFGPDVDCTACKSMVPYAESVENADLLGFAHIAEGVGCIDCHGSDQTRQAHEEAIPGESVKPLRIQDEFCLGCHLENQHSSYEELAERTANYEIGGEVYNPHAPHPDTAEVEAVPCWRCHSVHKESHLVNGCYAGCHHQRNFENCNTCHKE